MNDCNLVVIVTEEVIWELSAKGVVNHEWRGERRDPPALREQVCPRLAAFLTELGASSVRFDVATDRPQRDPRTGKFRQVWAGNEVQTPNVSDKANPFTGESLPARIT